MDVHVKAGMRRECVRQLPPNGDGSRSAPGGLHELVDVWEHPQPFVLQRGPLAAGATPPNASALPAMLADEACCHTLSGVCPQRGGGLGSIGRPRQPQLSPLHNGLCAIGPTPPLAASPCMSHSYTAVVHAACITGQGHPFGTGPRTLPGMERHGHVWPLQQPQPSPPDGQRGLETMPRVALSSPALGGAIPVPNAPTQRAPHSPALGDSAAHAPLLLGSSSELCTVESSNSLSFDTNPVAVAENAACAQTFVASSASNGICIEARCPSYHEVGHGAHPSRASLSSVCLLGDTMHAAERSCTGHATRIQDARLCEHRPSYAINMWRSFQTAGVGTHSTPLDSLNTASALAFCIPAEPSVAGGVGRSSSTPTHNSISPSPLHRGRSAPATVDLPPTYAAPTRRVPLAASRPSRTAHNPTAKQGLAEGSADSTTSLPEMLQHEHSTLHHQHRFVPTDAPSTALESERGWFGKEEQPSGTRGIFKPYYVDPHTPLGSPELVLLRTTGIESSHELAAFNELCADAGLYGDKIRRAMLGRHAKQGYRVLLLVIDHEVCAGALFCVAHQVATGSSELVVLDMLMLAVATPYRFIEGVQTGRGYGSRVIDALEAILLGAAGKRPAHMLVRACDSARPFYEVKRSFVADQRARLYAVALRDWYSSNGLTHYGNHPELTTLLWSQDGLHEPPPCVGMIDAHSLLIERGAAAYRAAVGLTFESRKIGDGATLRNGRVCIRRSPVGGGGGRGLFPGPEGVGPTDFILYSGELISAGDARARSVCTRADYILQLGYRADSDRIDGRMFAEAISHEPDQDGRYWPVEDWAFDAGPACIANEDRATPNAKYELRYIDKKRDLGPYRVIVPLRLIGPTEEIRTRYTSNTPREHKAATSSVQMGDRAPPTEVCNWKRRRLLSRQGERCAVDDAAAVSAKPSRCAQTAGRGSARTSYRSHLRRDDVRPTPPAYVPVSAHTLEHHDLEVPEGLEEAQELCKQLVLYTTFLQGKLEAMSKEAMHRARPEVIHAIAQQTYSGRRESATSPPTQASIGNEQGSKASLPLTNERARREARLLTIWGWDRNPH